MRLEWEHTIDDMSVIEKIDENTLIFLQVLNVTLINNEGAKWLMTVNLEGRLSGVWAGGGRVLESFWTLMDFNKPKKRGKIFILD